MENSLYFNWFNVYKACLKIVQEIKATYEFYREFEIVTIARGGLVPSTLIAHALGIEKIHVWSENMCSKSMPDEDKRLFFIDDILDTRKTFEKIRLAFFNYDIKYCFMTAKDTNRIMFNNNQGMTIFIGKWVPNIWIDFPWEKIN